MRMELEAELEDLEHAELEERLLLAMDHSTSPCSCSCSSLQWTHASSSTESASEMYRGC